MKRLIFVIIVFVFALVRPYLVKCQNDKYNFKYEAETNIVNHLYGPPTEFLTEHIVSDYGKRLKATSNWHKGVDFNVQSDIYHWDHFLSLNNCVIRKLQGGAGYKYIITQGTQLGEIDHFGYGHLFDDSPASPPNIKGDLILVEMDNISPKQYAIIRSVGYPFEAIGSVSGTATYNGTVYNVISTVDKDEVLGNIGRSGGNPNYQHVHVYMFKNISEAIIHVGHKNKRNDRDPLEVISHQNTNYEVSISTDNNVNNGIVTSSGITRISFKTSYSMLNEPTPLLSGKFANVVMDIDDIDVFIKPSYISPPETNDSEWGSTNSDYKLLRGEFVDSHLSHGARLNSEIYPIEANVLFGTNANPPTNTEIDITPDGQYGSWTSTGIDPFAYRTGTNNKVYDDYYFSDFYTRVKRGYNLGDYHDFAFCNEKAMYPDGKYNIYARVVTVRGDIFSTKSQQPTEIIIDNFRPFIKKVEIRKYPSLEVPEYSRSWDWNGSTYLFKPPPCNECPDIKTDDVLTVSVYSSEPLFDDISMELNGYTIANTSSNDSKDQWSFTIIPENIIEGENTLIIDGTDLAGNNILNDPSVVPIRQDNNQWTPNPTVYTGPDENHSFFAFAPLEVDFTATQLAYDHRTILFQDKSTIENIETYEWDFGDGGNSIEIIEIDVTHQYSNPGTYEVTHSVQDNLANNYSISKNVIVKNLTTPVSSFIYSINVLPERDNQVSLDFYDQSEGIIDTWEWTFDNGIEPSNKQNPTRNFNMFTEYDIMLRVTNAAGNDTYYHNNFYYDPATTPQANIIAWQDLSFYYTFDVGVLNLEGSFTYEIDYGDGTSETVENETSTWLAFEHQYFNWDDYLVTAHIITNANGETVFTATEITVQAWDLDVQLSYTAPTSPPNPGCQEVTINANVSGAGNVIYWGTWYISKIGSNFYFSDISPPGETLELIFNFPSAGTYKVGFSATTSGSGGLGYDEIKIVVEDGPQFIDGDFYPQEPIQLGLGSTQTFTTSIWPIGNPGIPESQWCPTNLRWTLFATDGTEPQLITTTNEEFPWINYQFIHYETFTFDQQGEYMLRLEVWNNTHNYEEENLLDPECKDNLPFYDVSEKTINVSADIPFLEITEPANQNFYPAFDANAHPTNQIKLTNPGSDEMIWDAVKYEAYGDITFFGDISTFNTIINNGEIGSTYFNIYENTSDYTKYGAIKFTGLDNEQNDVQGSPSYVYFEQSGNMGPRNQFVYNDPPIQDENFGYSVGVDDKYAVIGAVDDNGNGKAYIAERNNVGIWNVVATLQASSLYDDYFGRSADIHGEYVIVGAWNKSYIFKRPASGWTGTITETASYNSSNNFGYRVSIWDDWAVVSEHETSKVRVFYKNQNEIIDSWGLNKTIAGISGTEFGYQLDLYNDILAVGVPNEGEGKIKIYNRNLNQSNDWGLEHTITETSTYYVSNTLGKKGIDIYDSFLNYAYKYNYNGLYINGEMQHRNESGQWSGVDYNPHVWAMPGEDPEIFYNEVGKNIAMNPSSFLGTNSSSSIIAKPYNINVYNNIVGGSVTTWYNSQTNYPSAISDPLWN